MAPTQQFLMSKSSLGSGPLNIYIFVSLSCNSYMTTVTVLVHITVEEHGDMWEQLML